MGPTKVQALLFVEGHMVNGPPMEPIAADAVLPAKKAAISSDPAIPSRRVCRQERHQGQSWSVNCITRWDTEP